MQPKYLSIAIATILALVLGFVWYRVIFKDTLPSNDKLHPALFYVLCFLLAGVVALGLWKQIIGLHSYIISMSDDPTRAISESPFFHGMLHGAQMSVYAGAISAIATTTLFYFKGWKQVVINVVYWLITMTLMGGVIGTFG